MTPGRLFPQRDLLLDLQLSISAAISVCELSRKVRWHLFLLSVIQGTSLSASEAIWPYCISNSEDSQTESTWQGCSKAEKSGSARVRSFITLLAKLSLLNCTCTHTTEMHSSGLTGWMQIGFDRLRAVIYWVIGATHEWRCSTTHSKSPILLFIPTAGLSPSPSAHSSLSLQSHSTISQHSSMSGHIHLSPLTLPSILKDYRGEIFIWLYSNCGNPREGYGMREDKEDMSFLGSMYISVSPDTVPL